MRREPPPQPRLYREQWMTLLRRETGTAQNLTPALVNDLWKTTRDVFLLRPEAERLIYGADGEPILDQHRRPRLVQFSDVLTNNGIEFMEDLGTAEIVRSDENFMPELKITRKIKRAEQKALQEVLNLTFDHPETGRQRLGRWTPFDASRFVMPRITQQGLKLAERGNYVSRVIARCSAPDIPILDQINAEPPDDEEA